MRGTTPARWPNQRLCAVVLFLLAAVSARCSSSGPATSVPSDTTLRVGVDDAGSASASAGLGPLVQILSTEGLARIGEDGRPTPSLAKEWNTSSDGRTITITLRPEVKFHDGTPLRADVVVTNLNRTLPLFMGPAFGDVEYIRPASDTQVEIGFKHPSPFLLEALEAPIRKPGSGGGTGPFVAVGPSAPNEMRANADYYLGRPKIDRIVVNPYPNVRSAWADMLRDKIDMLYEVGTDALDSLTAAKAVSVYTYIRHYQYVLIFNTRTPSLQSRDIRQALAKAVDRNAIIHDAFDGHAIPSAGPVWPQHWASSPAEANATYEPKTATATLTTHPVRFTFLVRPGLDRIALVLKRQLEAVGATVSIEELPLDVILKRMTSHDFDAVLTELISGPSLLRPYQVWHSGGPNVPNNLGTATLDDAFDRVRSAHNDAEYRAAVNTIQQAINDDPPGLFLVWPARARAVNRRFDVAAEPDLDVLPRLRLWQPANAQQQARRN